VIYLLDTNAVVALLRNRPAEVRERLRRVKAQGGVFAVSSVALFELWYGVARSRHRERNAERLHLFLSGDVAAIAFGEQDAPVAGELRRTLEAAGTPIGAYDLLIAAQALRAGVTLVTANVAEFARVPGLVWEDWTAAG
jgi:tRNA(fMet)-specific endonuclease VapC